MICDKCNGVGYENWEESKNNAYFYKIRFVCDKCFGSGDLDWIDIIFGKEKLKELKYEILIEPITSIEKIELNFEVK
jgi:DnaJ-class molecular chaperone